MPSVCSGTYCRISTSIKVAGIDAVSVFQKSTRFQTNQRAETSRQTNILQLPGRTPRDLTTSVCSKDTTAWPYCGSVSTGMSLPALRLALACVANVPARPEVGSCMRSATRCASVCMRDVHAAGVCRSKGGTGVFQIDQADLWTVIELTPPLVALCSTDPSGHYDSKSMNGRIH